MNFKTLLFVTIITFLFGKSVFCDEIKIDSTKIKILEEGNIISALNVKAKIQNKQIELEGDSSVYNKKKNQLTITKNVKFFDNSKNIYIETEKAVYSQLTDILQTFAKLLLELKTSIMYILMTFFMTENYKKFLLIKKLL